MNVVSIKLKSIEARRYAEPNQMPKQLRIDHNSTVTNITTNGENNAEIEFQYTTSYGPVGMVRIEGNIIFEHRDVNGISEMWKKSRKMPDDVATIVHNTIMQACLPEAVSIAKDLSLPPPIPLPQIKIGGQPKGKGGPEIV